MSKAKCAATRRAPPRAVAAVKAARSKSRKQAIAIGLSKARKKGKKVPKKRTS
jgi:hypothetical protein